MNVHSFDYWAVVEFAEIDDDEACNVVTVAICALEIDAEELPRKICVFSFAQKVKRKSISTLLLTVFGNGQ